MSRGAEPLSRIGLRPDTPPLTAALPDYSEACFAHLSDLVREDRLAAGYFAALARRRPLTPAERERQAAAEGRLATFRATALDRLGRGRA